jgi:hypothetical protein
MPAAWLSRLQVIVLAAIVLAGGPRLPVLDALIYHTQGPDAARRAGLRWEAAGTPRTHADRCTLGQPAPVPRAESVGGTAPRLIAFTFQRPAPLPYTAPRAVDLPAPLQSRAPPALEG